MLNYAKVKTTRFASGNKCLKKWIRGKNKLAQASTSTAKLKQLSDARVYEYKEKLHSHRKCTKAANIA